MSDSKTHLKCPLCEGRGELPEDELFARLQEKDLCRKMASFVDSVVKAEEATVSADGPQNKTPADARFQHDVDSWNCTHFLWRRSPKE